MAAERNEWQWEERETDICESDRDKTILGVRSKGKEDAESAVDDGGFQSGL